MFSYDVSVYLESVFNKSDKIHYIQLLFVQIKAYISLCYSE